MTTDTSEIGATMALLRYFLSICNEALAHWRAIDRDGKVVAAIIAPLEGKTFVVDVTDESAIAIASSGVAVRGGSFLMLPEADVDSKTHRALSRVVLEDVWAHAGDYIDRPWRLDWSWPHRMSPGASC
jgi:hypothetical protein